jgi:hypothetical protein
LHFSLSFAPNSFSFVKSDFVTKNLYLCRAPPLPQFWLRSDDFNRQEFDPVFRPWTSSLFSLNDRTNYRDDIVVASRGLLDPAQPQLEGSSMRTNHRNCHHVNEDLLQEVRLQISSLPVAIAGSFLCEGWNSCSKHGLRGESVAILLNLLVCR